MGYQAYDAGSESQNGGGQWGCSLDNHSAARAISSVVRSLTAYGADSVRMVSGSLHRLGIGGLCHARAQRTTESTTFVLRQRTQVRRHPGGVFLDPLHCAADAANVLVSEQAVFSMEEADSVRLSPAGVQSVSLGSLASSGDPQEDFPPLSTHGQSTSAVLSRSALDAQRLRRNRRTLSSYLFRWGIWRAMEVALCGCIPSKMWARLYTRDNDFSTFIVASVDTSRVSMETLPWVAMVACRLNTSAVSFTTLPKYAARTLDCSNVGTDQLVSLSSVMSSCDVTRTLTGGYVTNVVRRRHRVVAAIFAAMFYAIDAILRARALGNGSQGLTISHLAIVCRWLSSGHRNPVDALASQQVAGSCAIGVVCVDVCLGLEPRTSVKLLGGW